MRTAKTDQTGRMPRLWSDWADTQADLSLRWAHSHFCWFCHEAAYMSRSIPFSFTLSWQGIVKYLHFPDHDIIISLQLWAF